MYENIVKDDFIINLYNKISVFEDKQKGWAHHNLEHVINVAQMTETILKQLNYEEDYINNAKVAALLHDIGCIEGKDDHANRSAIMSEKYFKKNKIKLKYEEDVIKAIKNHSSGFFEEKIMTQILIFCDKLDIKKTRVAEEGYNVVGMRQLQYIEDITISINDSSIFINFIMNKAIDLNELEQFYFIHKVFKAIDSFSKSINRIPIIKINNKDWNL